MLSDTACPFLAANGLVLEPLGRRLAEMLLAAMPRYATPDGPRILREVWPLALTPRESDSPHAALLHDAEALDSILKARDRSFEHGGQR